MHVFLYKQLYDLLYSFLFRKLSSKNHINRLLVNHQGILNFVDSKKKQTQRLFLYNKYILTYDLITVLYFDFNFKGQPDFKGKKELCLELRSYDFLLNDIKCDNENYALCKTSLSSMVFITTTYMKITHFIHG